MATVTCSNCSKPSPAENCLCISKGVWNIAYICEECQQAQKIRVTLVRLDPPTADPSKILWKYDQYFPVEPLKEPKK